MARLARIVVPGLPHNVTQRGNRRETVFFGDADCQPTLDLLKAALVKSGSQVWAWCLMPNHVHLVVLPTDADGLRRSVADAHRRYSARINARNRWTGHLWQARFGCVVMDEDHLIRAIAYVSLNPVRAGLVKRATDWRWSSVHPHLAGEDDAVTTVEPVLSRTGDFSTFLTEEREDELYEPLRRAEEVGRPVGAVDFIAGLEKRLARRLFPQKRGPKSKRENQSGLRDRSS